MSSEDEFHDAADVSDLEGFLASDDEDLIPANPTNSVPNPDLDSADEEEEDRIGLLNKELKPNEDYTQKVLKAHINVLVSTLGGPDHTSNQIPPPYRLGPDALPCLKDIKRWILIVDQKHAKFDVALAISDSGLVTNDLLVILCDWDTIMSSKKQSYTNGYYLATLMDKIALACLELLVSLTWPYEITEQLSVNQRLRFNDMKKAQLTYKKYFLAYNNGQVFKAVLRLALPCLSQDKTEREPRDNAILRLVLFFLRNVLYIDSVPRVKPKRASGKKVDNYVNLPANVSADDISRSNVITTFKKNKVLMFLLTMAGSIDSDFDQDSFCGVILESIFLLIDAVPVKDLLTPVKTKKNPLPNNTTLVPSHSTVAGLQLQDLLKEETKLKKHQTDNISTRHGRFGSLLSIRSEDSSYVVSGQEALMSRSQALDKLDRTKKWRAPIKFKYDSNEYVTTTPVNITASSALILKEFVESFLVGGCFNTLVKANSRILANSFTSLSDANMLGTVDALDKANFFSVISWFFNYKRERNAHFELLGKTPTEEEDQLDYGSVGEGLSDVSFILVGQYLRESYSTKKWSSLHVALICLREMLLISHSIFIKPTTEPEQEDEDSIELQDKDMAEGIIRKLFTEIDYVNLLVQIPRSAHKHSPEYLGVVVSVVHILLKCFETFSNQDVKLFIRSKRRQKKQADPEEGFDSADEDESRHIYKERQLNYQNTEIQFFHRDTITSYVTYLSRYEDLLNEDIKKCLHFFHKLFAVRKDYTALYRLDFMYMLYKLRNGVSKSASVRKHIDEFIAYFMKKFKTAFDRFPTPIELLFPRFEDKHTKSFMATGQLFDDKLDYGYAEDDESSDRFAPGYLDESIDEPRKAKPMVFLENLDWETEMEILVSCLCQTDKGWFIEWLISDMERLVKDRILASSVDVLLPSPIIRRLLISNTYIRMLVERLGFKLPELQNDATVLPGTVESDVVARNISFLKGAFEKLKDQERDTSVFSRLKAERKKQVQRRERKDRFVNDLEDIEVEKPSRYIPEDILSSKFVNDSDDESDEEKENEFFAKEERLRRLLDQSGGIVNAEQLEAFKKVWKDAGVSLESIEAKANEVLHDEEVLHNSSDSESDTNEFSQVRSETHNSEDETISSKRRRVVSDVEDEGDTMNYETAEEEHKTKRSKFVISDDEDD